ncbi:DNA-binding transcriptional regulator, GntR family [Rhizobiales bacterium GAS191]|nr:DNA-binding transcriptional regulator, GntR family [Rhizobiales bacterium GAS113]SEB87874.1 DNA-binding transcriptional regulator, GntR family [Rhizobiales bacterium GAS188]SED36476.1 DNA-binding transcriptional regulator, GntR family [Rhizobiales bacterium GAS191]
MEAARFMRPLDFVYDEVKRRIMLNELKPGEVLTELGVARELGCSQGTVREALFRLQEDGLVTRHGRRGTTVTRLDPDEAQEILALRRRIETRGALKAVRLVDDAALEKLAAIEAAMEDSARADEEHQLTALDIEFHQTLFALSGLEALEQILTRCMLHAHRWRLWAPSHRRPLIETARRHIPIIERLAARDSEGLAEVIGHHIDTIVTGPAGSPA